MLGNERTPQPKFGEQLMQEYYYEIKKNNINYMSETIRVRKIVCVQGLGLRYAEPNYNGPSFRIKEWEAYTKGVDAVTPYDVDVAMYLIDLIKQAEPFGFDNEVTQVIMVNLNANTRAIMRDAGVL